MLCLIVVANIAYMFEVLLLFICLLMLCSFMCSYSCFTYRSHVLDIVFETVRFLGSVSLVLYYCMCLLQLLCV